MAPCLLAILSLCIYSSFAKEILKHILGTVNTLPAFTVSVAEKAI